MMMIMILICMAMSIAGFIMSSTGQDALKSLSRSLGLRDERGSRPITRNHAMAAAGIGKTRTFGRR
jgi:hypothetical protein